MKNWNKYIKTYLFLIFLYTPILLGFLKIKPKSIENRNLVARPSISLNSVLNVDFYQSVSAYLEDRFPLRPLLIRTNSAIDYYLLKSSPSEKVIIGKDEWLFMTESLTWPCDSSLSPQQLLSPIAKLATVLEERNKTFHLILAPNKSSIYPKYLPESANKVVECAHSKRQEIRQYMNDYNDFNIIESWPHFLERSKHSSSPLFPPLGRHWDSVGGILFAELIVNSLDPTIWDKDAVIPFDQINDYAELPLRFMNLEIEEVRDRFIVQRSGIKVQKRLFKLNESATRESRIFDAVSVQESLIEGRTLIIHDSFIDDSINALEKYMDELYLVHWSQLDFQDEIIEIIADSDHIVFEVVEDHRYFQLSKIEDNLIKKMSYRLNQNP